MKLYNVLKTKVIGDIIFTIQVYGLLTRAMTVAKALVK